MKTNIFNLKGLLAFAFTAILVVSMSAFKSSSEKSDKRARYTFYYNGPLAAAQADVEQETNWVTTPPLSCDNVNQRPCTIEVDANYVNTGSTPTLKSTLNISADLDAIHGTYFVDGSADGSMNITNKSN
ncbi:hypothetical protein GJU39_01305 [Pedobacter petrophilus]|uniref:Uncharacterized protein n=1 Tax=Pedobacter petrophilus TaxID=1908241 RepID=A0A7K0FTJ9_9SPHI|nr:hypothetical protein [Pedobacter petrophilus]MRX74711.1 hypothetical protein [Pedobacter petrophilus]